MISKKQIILCADDYGLNAAVSQGIRQLVARHRLSAVSCMVQEKSFAGQAQQLLALAVDIDIGLHLNFTEGYFLTTGKPMPSLSTLLIRSQLRLLSARFIKQEVVAQVDKFVQAFGRLPDFIDGHQHIHHLPVIREAVLEIYQERLRHHGVYLRSVYPAIIDKPYRLKRSILTVTGAYKFKQTLKKQAVLHNPYFMGIYDFNKDTDYRALFTGFLARAQSGALIMCHPGLAASAEQDVIAHARLTEYTYFASDHFQQDCKAQQVELIRYRALTANTISYFPHAEL